MSTSQDPHKSENPSTYVILDAKSKRELSRLIIQDQMLTNSMGSVLPEQENVNAFQRVLDIACGPGSWVIQAAQNYPNMSLIGIDINARMIEYARQQADEAGLTGRVEFHVMDALRPLAFPNDFFDLVNLRAGIGWIRTWEWPHVISEILRITRPGGVVRLTDGDALQQTSSPAEKRLLEMGRNALFQSGHLFSQESVGLNDDLAPLLTRYGCQHVQVKNHALHYQAGTEAGKAYYEDWKLALLNGRPFIEKWSGDSDDYEKLYQQALVEMQQPDFSVTWNFTTAWGYKASVAQPISGLQ